jgi:hypothetical protein
MCFISELMFKCRKHAFYTNVLFARIERFGQAVHVLIQGAVGHQWGMYC